MDPTTSNFMHLLAFWMNAWWGWGTARDGNNWYYYRTPTITKWVGFDWLDKALPVTPALFAELLDYTPIDFAAHPRVGRLIDCT